MSSASALSCAVCSVKFEDLDSLLQHMAGHSAAAATPAGPAPPANARQIVLSQTAFLRLQPILQQNAGKSMVIVTQPVAGAPKRIGAARIRPRPPPPPPATEPVDTMDVEVLEPVEPADAVEHRCRMCKRRFKHRYSLVAHCRQHLMSRLCGVCHRRLPDGQALVQHLETHMEKNSTFKCDQCDKSFVHAKSLYVHKRNHSGVRPYTCQYCLKTFRHWHKHRVHVRIHTGERPYRCDVCGWGFPRNDERKRHMRTHVGKKAFHCIDCGVGCGTQMALMSHIEIHHPAESRAPAPAGAAYEADAPVEATPQDEGVVTGGNRATTPDENFDDLDEEITVKIEMDATDDAAGAGANDGDDGDDPPYRVGAEESDSTDDDTEFSTVTAVLPHAAAAEPDPEATEQETAGRCDGEAVFIKVEPRDADDADVDQAARGPWGSEDDGDLDAASARLLEPEVNLTEMFIDVKRMRDTIRRKIAANAHKFDDSIAKKARSFVRNPEPAMEQMKSILRAKLEEGKQIQELLRRSAAERQTKQQQLQAQIQLDRKTIKVEPSEPSDESPTAAVVIRSPPRLTPTVRVGNAWTARPAGEVDVGRTSDPTATPRVPRRRWIQHELNFARGDGTMGDPDPPGGVRMSTGFGEL